MAGFGDIPVGDASAFGGSVGTMPQAQSAATTVTQPKVGGPQSGLGKWLVDNAPAIGGTIGGVAALPLNLLDAVTGVGGTALDIGAAAGGGAIGKQIQQSIRGNGGSAGQQALNDAGSGAVQGVTQGIAHGAGALLGLAGRTVLKPVVEGAAAKATADAGQAAVDQAAPFLNVPKGIREGTAPGTGLNTIQGILKNFGMGTDPAAMHTANNVVTGPNGAVSGTVRQILAGIGDVPTGNIEAPIKAAIGQEAGNLGQLVEGRNASGAANNVLQEVRNTIGAKLYHGGGTVTNAADANDVFDAIQALGTKAAGKADDAASQSQAAVLNAAKTALEKQLYGHAGANDAVKAFKLAPEDEAAIRAEVEKQSGSSLLADHVINGINNAKNVQELRSMQAPFVAAGRLASAADRAAEGTLPKAVSAPVAEPAGTGGLLSKVAGQAVPMGALATAIPTHGASLLAIPAAKLAAKVADSVPVRTATGAALNATSKVVGGTAGSLLGQVAGRLGSQAAGQDISGNGAAPGTTGAPISPTTDLSGSLDQLGAGTQDAATQSATDSSPYSKASELADMARDPKNAAYYTSLYKEANPANPNKMSAVTSRQYAQVISADSRLNDFEKLMNQVVNQSGPGAIPVGLAREAGGALNLDTNAKNFNDIRSEMALSLSRALSGGNTTGSETMMKRIEGYIPQITDSKESAAGKMQLLHSMLEDTRHAILMSPSAGDTSSTDTSTSLLGQ